MTPNTFKQSAIWAVFILATMLFLAEGMAWSAVGTQSAPQQALSNTVTSPIPSKPGPGASIKVPDTNPVGQVISPQTATQNPNGTPSSCPLSLSTGPKGDIRDIRGPIHIPDPRLWLFYALAGILLLLLAYAVWKWFNKRKSLSSKEAFEIAFEELEKAKVLLTPEMAERFSVMVSRTIRTYIEKRFNMRATRKTTHEFITQVAAETSSELNHHSETLHEFLRHCDLAKFARQTFSEKQMEKMHQSAWRFVEETRPQPKENEMEKDPSHADADTMDTQTIRNNISGKKRLFKRGLKDGFPWTIGKDTGEQGFNSSHQVVTAGGR
ncbi:MAG: hypothetical protein GY846_21415 [Deltaproteobacteria bacterium]|nr:hypothetical protein [Deltaproteobacteria bacterium]